MEPFAIGKAVVANNHKCKVPTRCLCERSQTYTNKENPGSPLPEAGRLPNAYLQGCGHSRNQTEAPPYLRRRNASEREGSVRHRGPRAKGIVVPSTLQHSLLKTQKNGVTALKCKKGPWSSGPTVATQGRDLPKVLRWVSSTAITELALLQVEVRCGVPIPTGPARPQCSGIRLRCPFSALQTQWEAPV